MENTKKTAAVIALGTALVAGAAIAAYFINRARRRRMLEREALVYMLEFDEERGGEMLP